MERFLQRLCQYGGTIFLGLPLEGEAKKDGGLASPVGESQALWDLYLGCVLFTCFFFFFFSFVSVPLTVFPMRSPARLEALRRASSRR